MASREQIDQIRSQIDIVELVKEYVPSLKASGRSVKGLCPFHSERTPSFHVHAEKGLFKCFGCGESGDVIAFLCKMEQLNFSEALQILADKAGVKLERSRTFEQKQEPESQREKLFRVLETAQKIYQDLLWDERHGAAARQYLDERGITDETRETFGLGLAPNTGGGIFETLVQKGFSIELCQQAGLVSRSNAGKFYDPQFGRLVFPIFDSFGHVIGFGGRVLPSAKKHLLGGAGEQEETGPKYLNSPETPVFSKGRSLYGLFQSKTNILSSRRVIILEGYMDVIGVHQAGVKNAVATLGTAFTRDHAKVLKRYTTDITAFFDPDAAGEQAALRSLEPMIQEDFYPKVVLTEETGDPDEIIQQKGKEFFDELVNKAPDFLAYVVRVKQGSPQAPLDRKAAIAKEVLALIRQSPNEILKAEWTARLAMALGLRVESLESQIRKDMAKKPAMGAPSTPATRPLQPRSFPTAEEEWVQILVSMPRFVEKATLDASELSVEKVKRVYGLLQGELKEAGTISVPALLDKASPDDRDWLVQMSIEDRELSEPAERLAQLERDVRGQNDKKRLQQLSRLLATGQASVEHQAEYKNLLKRVKGSINDTKGVAIT